MLQATKVTSGGSCARSGRPTPLDQAGDPEICARCAKATSTCCFMPLGQEEYCFPLSQKEKERIMNELGLCAEEFSSSSPNSEGFLKILIGLFPKDKQILSSLFPRGESHLRIAVKPSGLCTLLGEHGCSLSKNARPGFCKLFPFWAKGKKIIAFNSPSCLATKSALELENLFALLNTSESELKIIYSNLRHDWGLPPG